MIKIYGDVIGSATLEARLSDLPNRVTMELRAIVARKTMELLTLAKKKVSGQLLKNRTGTLRRKLNATFDNEGLTGAVGIKLSYAPIHEFGFNGVVTVREHLRRAKASANPKAKLYTVREHKRKMILPEKKYLRGSLDELRPSIIEGMKDALGKAMAP